MELIVGIGTIVGIIAGLVQIRDSLNKGGRNNFQIFMGASLVIALIAYAAYFFYFGPKGVGDRFAENYKRFDANGMQRDVCQDSAVYDDFTAVGGIFSLGNVLLGGTSPVSITSTAFTPLSNMYQFGYQIQNPFGGDTEYGYANLRIKSVGLTDFCILDMSS
jgi:hypothetical protein